MSEGTHSEAQSYTSALSQLIGRYIPLTDYEVKLTKNRVKVTAGPHSFSFRAVLLNKQDLSELGLALQEAISRGEDPVEELAVQLGYLTEMGERSRYRSLVGELETTPVMANTRRSGLTEREIALIKAMLLLGKNSGFHSGRIQSYFSRPDRNVNPARIYEIRDGKLGADIPPASETELHDFLSRFEKLPTADDQIRTGFPRFPTPAYIGVFEQRIRLLPRNAVILEEAVEYIARENLLREQRRIASKLAANWQRFQVDQRLKEDLVEYANLADTDHRSLNVFSLDTEFNNVNKALGPDREGLGQSGEVLWDRFTQNHVILCNLYPEVRDYLAALASARPDSAISEAYAAQMTSELLSEKASEFVDPAAPNLIQEHLDKDTGEDQEAKRKRTYDVTALLSRTAALLYSTTHYISRTAATAQDATTLWNRVWVPLREILQFSGPRDICEDPGQVFDSSIF
jgi:hypothetical protein